MLIHFVSLPPFFHLFHRVDRFLRVHQMPAPKALIPLSIFLSTPHVDVFFCTPRFSTPGGKNKRQTLYYALFLMRGCLCIVVELDGGRMKSTSCCCFFSVFWRRNGKKPMPCFNLTQFTLFFREACLPCEFFSPLFSKNYGSDFKSEFSVQGRIRWGRWRRRFKLHHDSRISCRLANIFYSWKH